MEECRCQRCIDRILKARSHKRSRVYCRRIALTRGADKLPSNCTRGKHTVTKGRTSMIIATQTVERMKMLAVFLTSLTVGCAPSHTSGHDGKRLSCQDGHRHAEQHTPTSPTSPSVESRQAGEENDRQQTMQSRTWNADTMQ